MNIFIYVLLLLISTYPRINDITLTKFVRNFPLNQIHNKGKELFFFHLL